MASDVFDDMRLLCKDQSGGLCITDDLSNPPNYAILSHRWLSDVEEVSYLDVKSNRGHYKTGVYKLDFCLRQAHEDGLEYVWIDTCCINKNDQRELQKAITSMFAWYARAKQCYVLLPDVSSPTTVPGEEGWHEAFRLSSWFTRGWTLQELLAPVYLSFFSLEGTKLGTRESLSSVISEFTTIDISAMNGKPLHEFSVAQRFNWASGRQTTEPEDLAYSLLGVFGVTMLPHYGEGQENAFDRLKERIVAKHTFEVINLDPQRPMARTINNVEAKHVTTQSGNIAANLEATLPIERPLTISGPLNVTSTSGERRELQQFIRRQTICNYLKFDAMDARRSAISSALENTCSWLVRHPMYISWRYSTNNDILWITGHPGAGKSTLMKFMDYHIDTEIEETDEVLISFYFNARGSIVEKSVAGMYRALIMQLFSSVYGLDHVLDELRFGRRKLPEPHFFHEPPITVLEQIFEAAIQKLGLRKLYCLIDALDETDEEAVLEMISCLRRASSNKRMLICLASRHFPNLAILTPLRLPIDHEDGHRDDLATYIDRKLDVRNKLHKSQIAAEILSKGNGIFMWTVLVISILNKEYRQGNIAQIQSRMDKIPERLIELIREISQQGDVPQDRFLMCLQCILFAETPMVLEEFFFAMVAGLNNSATQDLRWDKEVLGRQDMINLLLTSSKGLAELSHGVLETVQFIHESIRDFLLDKEGLREIDGQLGSDALVFASAHSKLQECCYNYISFAYSIHPTWIKPDAPRKYTEYRLDALEELPFLDYAVQHVLSHANKAAKEISPLRFLQTFSVHEWFTVARFSARFSVRRRAHLTSIACESGHTCLVRAIMRYSPQTLWECCEQGGETMLMVAVAAGQVDIVQILLEAGVPVEQRDAFGNTAIAYSTSSEITEMLLAVGAIGIALHSED